MDWDDVTVGDVSEIPRASGTLKRGLVKLVDHALDRLESEEYLGPVEIPEFEDLIGVASGYFSDGTPASRWAHTRRLVKEISNGELKLSVISEQVRVIRI